MATKLEEIISTIDGDLRGIDGALLQLRQVQKELQACRDTLRFVRNFLQNPPVEKVKVTNVPV